MVETIIITGIAAIFASVAYLTVRHFRREKSSNKEGPRSGGGSGGRAPRAK